jgi:tetratricopeptide (TPR) repeat protein
MTATKEIELKELLQKLEKDPTNLDLINSLAIGYFENYDQKTDKEDYDNFEKAYNLKKTIKSTHNFAWFLFFEWSEIEWRWKTDNAIERAFQIQKECIALNPKSFYPYYQYGFMLLDQMQFKEAISFLEKAYQVEKRRDILHNIGYCHFQLSEYQKAKDCFEKAASNLDIENRSLYNLALSQWELTNIEQVKLIADKLYKDFESVNHETIAGYEIGHLYFLLDDLDRATECLIRQGINRIDLLDSTDLSYSLYMSNNELWKEKINERIVEQKQTCHEIEINHEDWSEYTDEEKKERLTELKEEIKLKEELLINGMTKPSQDLKQNVWLEDCVCLLFDCKIHGNRENE